MSKVRTCVSPHFSRYHAMLGAGARIHLNAGLQAVGGRNLPADTSADGGGRVSMADAATAAKMLIGETSQTQGLPQGCPPMDGSTQVVDGFGHSRDAYRSLVGHVFGLCAQDQPGPKTKHHDAGDSAVKSTEPQPICNRLWHQLWPGDPQCLSPDLVETLITNRGKPRPLQSFQAHGGTLESWWYHELVGLHALANLIWMTTDKNLATTLQQRLMQTVDYHIENTDPDNGSTQPWALAAFVIRPQTASFAERQLHDAEIALAQSDGTSGLVSGLLLADAAYALPSLEKMTQIAWA